MLIFISRDGTLLSVDVQHVLQPPQPTPPPPPRSPPQATAAVCADHSPVRKTQHPPPRAQAADCQRLRAVALRRAGLPVSCAISDILDPPPLLLLLLLLPLARRRRRHGIEHMQHCLHANVPQQYAWGSLHAYWGVTPVTVRKERRQAIVLKADSSGAGERRLCAESGGATLFDDPVLRAPSEVDSPTGPLANSPRATRGSLQHGNCRQTLPCGTAIWQRVGSA
ncbi:uncharacterized protein V1518DRAFT_409506 [Limtongia smithiae]|uniref:uncharacterized protein n=1 Tax=Limtongia smithiae TaxID=1125753 RepID=UPI0034CE2F90